MTRPGTITAGRWLRVRALAAIAMVLAALAPGRAPAQDAPPDDAAIARAIDRGLSYLREQQGRDGSWRFRFSLDHRVGMTALAGLALLENGVSPDDPAVSRAADYLEEAALESNQTYDLSLAILFLSRVQGSSRGRYEDRIRDLGARLAAGHRQGMWSYLVPDDARRSARFELLGGMGDNSNTQFAVLGVWAAGRQGFDSNPALAAIERHFRSTQNEDGSWPYQRHGGGSEAMTCAGLLGLAVSTSRPERAERLSARARGAELAADPAFVKGLKLVAELARRIDGDTDIYFIWSLERLCVALGLKELDGLDWYAAGARELLARQRRDGSWPESRWGSLPDTCLALLFLRKSNLAFELDRVLKLPAAFAAGPAAAQPPGEPAPPTDDVATAEAPTDTGATVGDDSVTVIVRGADEHAFPEITVDFEVKHPDGSPLLDATREDFRVTEDDRPVEILKFQSPLSKELRPTTVVLVVDRSLSMEEENRIDGLKSAVDSFLKVMPEGSRVAVVAFGSNVEPICPFTPDAEQVRRAVNALHPAGATRYYDAVAEAIKLIGKETGRRAILALTDGEDTFSQDATLESVIAQARTAGVPVHTLGLGSEDEIASPDLRRLAAETRGRYFPARRVSELASIYEEIAKGLGQSYTATYRTDRKLPDGTLRPVRVYYRASQRGGETAVFIPGMVVPVPGWSAQFLGLLAALAALAVLPAYFRRAGRVGS